MLDSRSVRYSTDSHEGHLTHRPSGTDLRGALSERWMRGGRSFSSQLIATSFKFRVAELYRLRGHSQKIGVPCGKSGILLLRNDIATLFVKRLADAGDEAAHRL